MKVSTSHFHVDKNLDLTNRGLSQQDTIGHEFDDRSLRGFVFEANGVPYFLAKRKSGLLCNTLGDRDRSNTSRLLTMMSAYVPPYNPSTRGRRDNVKDKESSR